MRLTLQSPHLSLKKLDSVTLSEFTVLTGFNGVGKTHLLDAIKSGKCKVDNITESQIKYENYSTFVVSNAGASQPTQILQQKQEGWNQFSNSLNNFNARSVLAHIYNSVFIIKRPDNTIDIWRNHEFKPDNIWDIDANAGYSKEFLDQINLYKEKLVSDLFKSEKFTKLSHSSSIIKTIKKYGKPAHLMSIEEFFDNFSPSVTAQNHLATSLSTIFTNHLTVRSSWVYSKFEERRDIKVSKEDLEREFDQINPKPWNVLNKIIREIHTSSQNKEIFDFSILPPHDLPKNPYDISSYSFTPALRKNKSNQNIEFKNLSSGEKVLFALAISVFQSKDGLDFPKLILLDEIDASLHPSMTRALIQTINSAFIDNDVKIILTTHSPSTIALSPEDSIFVLRHDTENHVIEKQSRKAAMELISEGFSTLDEGISIFNDTIQNGINIMTEGNNAKIIKRALQLYGYNDVYVIPKFEGKTGQDQLAAIFEFFCLTDHKQPILFVLDVDVSKNKQDKGLNFWIKLPRNEKNLYTQRGIENIFPSEFLEEFLYSVTKGGIEKKYFDGDKKKEFSDYIIQQEADVFSVFRPLFDKIDQIKATHQPGG